MTDTDTRAFADLARLDGRVALVTGAASGIGLATVGRLREAGAVVHGVDDDDEAMAAAADALGPGPTPVHWHRADVTDDSRADEVLAACGGRLDVLVNNAGVFPPSSLFDAPGDLWQRLSSVNVDGTLTS